ncbi:MAG TPA: hypothetical protein VEU96_24130 [Bryobacteraceae bacterium]|nr:hypothetical protein [Bryobacteraceae bacterium]
MLQSYLLTVGTCAMLASGGVVCLCVFLSLKSEIRKLRARLINTDVRSTLEEMNGRLREAEERAGMLVAPAPLRSGLNLNKRTQVIRMSRRGERSESIAASLSLPRRQVELLLKVHSMALNSSCEPIAR